jgi:hypothetical protein
MYKALASAKDKSSKNNYGFLRDAAILSIVLISDETDCSYNPEFQGHLHHQQGVLVRPRHRRRPVLLDVLGRRRRMRRAGPDLLDLLRAGTTTTTATPASDDEARCSSR